MKPTTEEAAKWLRKKSKEIEHRSEEEEPMPSSDGYQLMSEMCIYVAEYLEKGEEWNP